MIIKVIQERRSIRQFKPDPVSDELITEIVKAGQFAPSARGNHGIEYIVVKDQTIKDKLAKVLIQPFVNCAPVLVVPILEKNKSVLPIQDISIASENMMLQATELGLGSVWKNIGEDLVDQVKQILNIGENYTVINLLPIGYPQTYLPPHTDNDFDKKKIYENKYK